MHLIVDKRLWYYPAATVPLTLLFTIWYLTWSKGWGRKLVDRIYRKTAISRDGTAPEIELGETSKRNLSLYGENGGWSTTSKYFERELNFFRAMYSMRLIIFISIYRFFIARLIRRARGHEIRHCKAFQVVFLVLYYCKECFTCIQNNRTAECNGG